MSAEKSVIERILNLLRPFASNWSGTLSRGDLVIPQREIPRLVQEILASLEDRIEESAEAGEREIFETLMEIRRIPSVQEQAAALRHRFLVLKR